MRLAYTRVPGLMASTYFAVMNVARVEGLTMSLSASEQQALDSIKDGLAGSDPQLVALLSTFTRLASGEDMPVQEEIPVGPRRKPRNRLPAHASMRLQWVMLALLFVITALVITVAVVLGNGGGQGACTGAWPPVCSHSVSG
jgi:hypothetical protein